MTNEQKITCSNIWKLFGPDEKRIIKELDNNLSIKESLEKGTMMSSKIIQKIGARLN